MTITVTFSCKDDGEIIYNLKRTIKNQSGVEVKIISFFNRPDTVSQLTLANGEESTVSATFTSLRGKTPRSITPHLFETVHYVDSVILVFNNSKFQVHCGTVTSETPYTTSATVLLINETAVVIKSYDSIQGYEIQPGDTLIHTESYTQVYGQMPTVDSYVPLAGAGGLFLYGNSSKCENGVQDENINDMNDGYSAIFIDLVDNQNQRFTRGHKGSTDYPDDNVVGYRITQLQSAVKNSRKLEHVRDYLRDNYHNKTQGNLNNLFDFYIDIQ